MVRPGGRYGGNVSSSGVSLESIGWIAKRVPLKGRTAFDFTGEGDVKNPGAEGTIDFEDVALYGRPLGNFSFHGEARDGTAALAGTGDFPLEAWYRWETGDFSAALSLAKKDLAPFSLSSGLPGGVGKPPERFGSPAMPAARKKSTGRSTCPPFRFSMTAPGFFRRTKSGRRFERAFCRCCPAARCASWRKGR